MFMERIAVLADDVATVKPAKSVALKIAVGLVFVLLGALVMLPWTVAVLVWAGIAGTVAGAVRLAGLVRDTLVHAGELVVGR